MKRPSRHLPPQLMDLGSVGPATVRDLALLGVRTVEELAHQEAEDLYQRLTVVTGKAHDICCLDVFRAAIAQARDPLLPEEQRKWWYWSRLRLAASGQSLRRPGSGGMARSDRQARSIKAGRGIRKLTERTG